MKDEQWFLDRLGRSILCTDPHRGTFETTIDCQARIYWLLQGQEHFGYKFADVPIRTQAVCIACEG